MTPANNDCLPIVSVSHRPLRDQTAEALFMTVYGSPLLQAMVGLRGDESTAFSRIGRDAMRESAARKITADLERGISEGGTREAVVRALLYVGRGRPEQFVDERGFAVLRQVRAEMPKDQQLSMDAFKRIVHDQHLLLRLDEERALAALPRLLPDDAEERDRMLKIVRRVATATGEPAGEMKRRLTRVEALFRRGPPEGGKPTEEALWKVAASESTPAPKRQRSTAEAPAGGAERQTGSSD